LMTRQRPQSAMRIVPPLADDPERRRSFAKPIKLARISPRSSPRASLRLSPRERTGTTLCVIGGAHFFARRFDEAVPKLVLAVQEDPSYHQPYRYLAACYAHMGRLDGAREIVARLRTITPVLIPDASYLRKSEHRELLLSGLRLAAGDSD
jgi:Flp pilus assembly protein TadD